MPESLGSFRTELFGGPGGRYGGNSCQRFTLAAANRRWHPAPLPCVRDDSVDFGDADWSYYSCKVVEPVFTIVFNLSCCFAF